MVLFVYRKRILFCHLFHITCADPVFSVEPLDLSVKDADLGLLSVCLSCASCSVVSSVVIRCYGFRHLIGGIFRPGLQSDQLPAKSIIRHGSLRTGSLPEAVLAGSIISVEDQIRIICSFQQFFPDFLGGLFYQRLSLRIKTAGISNIFHAFPVVPERKCIQSALSGMYITGVVAGEHTLLHGALFVGNAAGGAVHAPGFESTVPGIHICRGGSPRGGGVLNVRCLSCCIGSRSIHVCRSRILCHCGGHGHQPDGGSFLTQKAFCLTSGIPHFGKVLSLAGISHLRIE